MRIFNFGSLNIDHVYRADHIVRPGETIASQEYSFFAGGKGANQSVAIARAGGTVLHVGKIGPEGTWMVDNMARDGVDVSRIEVADTPGGHALIQVDKDGQNAIVIHGGTNREIATEQIDAALDDAKDDDLVLVQNEINNVAYIIERAAGRGLKVCFNPAPMDEAVLEYPLDKVGLFIVNETEGEALCGTSHKDLVVEEMLKKYPNAQVIVTLGSEGVVYGDDTSTEKVAGENVKAVDTTGAGDTFIGYYLAAVQSGMPTAYALRLANKAAAISVTRAGAAASIPVRTDVSV